MNISYRRTQNVACIKYIWSLEVKCTRKWFWDLFLLVFIQTLDSSPWKFGLSLANSEVVSGRVILEILLKIDVFESFCSSRLFNTLHNCITAEWPDWTVSSYGAFSLYMQRFVVIFISLICCGKGKRACFNRPGYWMSVICLVILFCKNCRII